MKIMMIMMIIQMMTKTMMLMMVMMMTQHSSTQATSSPGFLLGLSGCGQPHRSFCTPPLLQQAVRDVFLVFGRLTTDVPFSSFSLSHFSAYLLGINLKIVFSSGRGYLSRIRGLNFELPPSTSIWGFQTHLDRLFRGFWFEIRAPESSEVPYCGDRRSPGHDESLLHLSQKRQFTCVL